VELVGTGDQTLLRTNIGGQDTDDLYLRVGKWNSWDLMAGRFEGWEVFHLGMGLDFNTFERIGAVGPGEADNQIAFYGLTDNQFRPSGAAGNLAFHYYPLRILRFELDRSTGLGLSIVRTLVTSELGGSIDLRSEQGPPDRPGTIAELRVPLAGDDE